jgi:hypothetical protein
MTVVHKVGLFRTHIIECCLTDGQVIADQSSLCNLDSVSGGCSDYFSTTPAYCKYVSEKHSFSATGTTNCEAVEAGAIICIILLLAALICSLAMRVTLALRRTGAGTLAVVALCELLVHMIVLILVKELVYDEQAEWIRTRYQASANLYPPVFNYELRSSYSLTAVSLAMHAVSAILASVSWYLGRKPRQPKSVATVAPHPSPRRVPSPRWTHIMPPRPVQNPVGSFSRQSESLSLCPDDLECDTIDDLTHRLQYAHSCRLPFCSDNSDSHQRHFLH